MRISMLVLIRCLQCQPLAAVGFDVANHMAEMTLQMTVIRFTSFRRERGDARGRNAFWLQFSFSLGYALAFAVRFALGLALRGCLALAFWFAFAFAFTFAFAFAFRLIGSGRDQARCGWVLAYKTTYAGLEASAFSPCPVLPLLRDL